MATRLRAADLTNGAVATIAGGFGSLKRLPGAHVSTLADQCSSPGLSLFEDLEKQWTDWFRTLSKELL